MDDNLGVGADGSDAYQVRELAALLQAVALSADGERGSRFWAGLAALTSRPVISAVGASGMAELADLRREPDDRHLAEKLARILLTRARTDGSFHSAMAAWRGEGQIQMLEKSIRRTGADSAARGSGGSSPAAPGRHGTLGYVIRQRGRAVKNSLFKSRWRKFSTWVASIATVAITGLVGAYSAGLGNHAAALSTEPGAPSGLPVQINSVLVTQSVKSPGTALPDTARLSKAQLARLNQLTRSEGYAAALSKLFSGTGGVPVGTSQVEIAVTGNAAQPTRITGINVVDKTCLSPLTGTLFYTGAGQGEGPTIAVDMNLDAVDPIPVIPSSGQAFFAVHTITLERGEQQTLIIEPATSHYYCHFEFQLAVLVGSQTTLETITNHGKPFQATAGPFGQAGVSFSRYGALYVGGDLNTSPTGGFVSENPATYNGGSIGPYAHGTI